MEVLHKKYTMKKSPNHSPIRLQIYPLKISKRWKIHSIPKILFSQFGIKKKWKNYTTLFYQLLCPKVHRIPSMPKVSIQGAYYNLTVCDILPLQYPCLDSLFWEEMIDYCNILSSSHSRLSLAQHKTIRHSQHRGRSQHNLTTQKTTQYNIYRLLYNKSLNNSGVIYKFEAHWLVIIHNKEYIYPSFATSMYKLLLNIHIS